MNTDSRGNKRGSFINDECDCEIYEYEEKSGAKCCYCFSPPTKYKN